MKRLPYENDGNLQPLLWYVEYNMELDPYKKVVDSPLVNLLIFIQIQDRRGEISLTKPKNSLSRDLAISFEFSRCDRNMGG